MPRQSPCCDEVSDHKEELLASIIRHGVEFRESAPAAHGPWAAGESGTAVPSDLGDSRVDAGSVPSRGRKNAGGPCQCPAGTRVYRRGSLTGATCQKLSREAELHRQRHPV